MVRSAELLPRPSPVFQLWLAPLPLWDGRVSFLEVARAAALDCKLHRRQLEGAVEVGGCSEMRARCCRKIFSGRRVRSRPLRVIAVSVEERGCKS